MKTQQQLLKFDLTDVADTRVVLVRLELQSLVGGFLLIKHKTLPLSCGENNIKDFSTPPALNFEVIHCCFSVLPNIQLWLFSLKQP